MSKYSPMRFDVEKYDGRINFGLWQVQVKDVLIQSGLHKALRGKPTPVSSKDSSGTSKDDDEEWEDLDLRAASAIRLCLAKNVLANVHGISTAKDLWEKLEQLYQGKGISNRLYLKEQFHTFRMDGDTKISDHLSVLNNIVSELEAIGVKVEDEDKTLRLILSLTSSYEHMKPILMYGKETLKYADVTEKLLSEEKRLGSSGHTSSEGTVLICGNGKKKHSQKIPVCWKCGQSGHVKRNCPGGADSASSSKSANNVSVVVDGDEFF
ncbi:putative RNA-directed DNA polymerase [Helianthus annuus]|nr:putative RNA-directed DNA polymerase [Helianthus annuus]